MKKRIFTFTLALIVCISVLPPGMRAGAASPFNIKDGVLISYDALINEGDNIVIPDGVRVIGEYAFNAYAWGNYNADRFNKWTLKIPDSVVRIEANAFYSCEGLTLYPIPSTVTEIGERAIGYSWNGRVGEESGIYEMHWIVISGAAGSAAEAYAISNGFTFEVDSSLYIDKPSSWAVGEIAAAIAAGIVPSYLQKNYVQPVSRGNIVEMIIMLIEKCSGQSIEAFMSSKGVMVTDSAFTDTNDKYALAANALNIINGVGDGRFDPDGTLTRAQIAAIMNRVARVLGVDTEGFTHSFIDTKSHWVDSELGWPVYAGIVNGTGDNKYNPDGQLTTEQAIAITYRALMSDMP